MKPMAILQTIQVGTPHRYDLFTADAGRERSWETSFFRTPSPERRWLAITHLAGNIQADTASYGTANQALLLYAAMHYPAWRRGLLKTAAGTSSMSASGTLIDESDDGEE
jgi:MOSC domain-containing protein YiiM